VIATIAIGYADGYNRLLSSRGRMLIHGRSAPIIGRVCMDQTMIDVGHVPDVTVGDEVVVFGVQGNAAISVDEISNDINTISYEVLTSVSDRVQRIYLT
jgi:alanine racemase